MASNKVELDSSKLKPVPQESKSNMLQTEAYAEVIEIGKCEWAMTKNGSRHKKGELCGLKTFDGEKYCCKHKTMAELRKSSSDDEEEKKHQTTVTSSIEIVDNKDITPKQPNIVIKSKAPPIIPLMPVPQLPNISSTITVTEMLAILDVFSRTVVGITESLKK